MSTLLFHRNNKLNGRSFEKASLKEGPDRNTGTSNAECHFRWEDDGGALLDNPADVPVPSHCHPHLGKALRLEKAMTWLQYAAQKAPQTRVLPDFKQAMRAMRIGSVLPAGSTRKRKVA